MSHRPVFNQELWGSFCETCGEAWTHNEHGYGCPTVKSWTRASRPLRAQMIALRQVEEHKRGLLEANAIPELRAYMIEHPELDNCQCTYCKQAKQVVGGTSPA